MKKYFLYAIIIAATCCEQSEARIVSSRIFGQRTDAKTSWIIRTGLSLNNATGSAVSDVKAEMDGYDRVDGYNQSYGIGCKAGYELSVAFNRILGRSGLYWGMELGLGTRGASYHSVYESQDGGSEYKENCNKYLLAWNVKYSPFTLGYKYAINSNIDIDAHIGAYASYDFAGTGHTKWDESYGGRPVIDESSDKIGKGDLEDYQPFDCGFQIGIGVWYKQFNFDITYQRGFINAYNMNYQSMWDISRDSTVNSSNLMLRVGFAF